MKSRVCPECGCIYSDGRAFCADCGEFTVKASERDIEAFGNKIKTAEINGLRDTVSNGGRELSGKNSGKAALIELVLRLLFGSLG